MEEMWDLVMPETPDELHGFGGRPETMIKLKKFLENRPLEGVFDQSDQFWANDTLPESLTVPGQNSEPSDEELSKAVQHYLSRQDLSTVTLRCVFLPLGR